MVFFPSSNDTLSITLINLNGGWGGLINGTFNVMPGIEYDIHGGRLSTHLSYAFKFTAIESATWGNRPIGHMVYCVNSNGSYMYIHGTDDSFYSMGTDIDFDEIKLFFPKEIQEIDINIPPTITDFVQQQITAKNMGNIFSQVDNSIVDNSIVDNSNENLKFSNFISNFEDGMNETNKKIVQIAKKEGIQSAVNGMFTGDNGEKLSYSEMRSRHG